ILILAAVLAVYLLLVRSHNPASTSTGYDEDQLPAIKVVILNGCGFEQLASEFAAAISHKNIEVVSLGDTPRPIYDKSIIVIRKGDMQDLKRLQKMTGITRWTSAQNEYYSADFDIIVGRDYESFIK
ncbi:MAG TPA: LytR C-terminal domain-containing protein, partial [Candidatus Cloacimonadota bacterium]|nr:LytR C-terminal domain-containing protein [Candidatus Cloacimonadota bacterium]